MEKLLKGFVACLAILIWFLFNGSVRADALAQPNQPPFPTPSFKEPFPTKRHAPFPGFRLTPDVPDASGVHAEFLGPGDGNVHGLIYRDGFLWASTRTNPARILKISPSSLSVVDQAELTGYENAEDIISVDYDSNGNFYLWAVLQHDTGSNTAQLVKVNPVDMFPVITPLTGMNNGTSIYYAFGKLWVGGTNQIAEVDITTDVNNPTFIPHNYISIKLPDAEFVQPTEITADSSHLFAAFLQGDFQAPDGYNGTTFVRIDPANPTAFLQQYLTDDFPDDSVFTNGYLFSSTEDAPKPSVAYRFPPTLTGYITNTISSSVSYGVFYTPTDPQSLWGAYVGSPGVIQKLNLNLDRTLEFNLPANFNDPSEIVFDDGGNMYVSTWMSPTGVIQYTIPDAVSLSISRSGSDAHLSWTNSDSLVDHYEVWRSTDPYFTPGMIGSSPYAVVPASVGQVSFIDPGVLGDVDNNYFYTVRASNDFGLLGPFSNRVGEIGLKAFLPLLASNYEVSSLDGNSSLWHWMVNSTHITENKAR